MNPICPIRVNEVLYTEERRPGHCDHEAAFESGSYLAGVPAFRRFYTERPLPKRPAGGVLTSLTERLCGGE